MGGAAAVIKKARKSYDQGDYRWVAEVMNHVVFADPKNVKARDLEAKALEQLGYQAESGPWRNFYLSRAVLNQVILGGKPALEAKLAAGDLKVDGNQQKLEELFALMDHFQPGFNIITP
jgi:alkyl sulfatase BDS1-like metallo-beta-lactamase superfamily hydrolase